MPLYPRKRKRRLRTKPRFWAIVLALALAIALFAGVRLALELRDYSAAGKEYDTLREQFAPAPVASPQVSPTAPALGATAAPTISPGAQPTATPEPTSPPDLSAINPDYIGWLRIEDTGVDYPMVQGKNNDKYLNTTFEGESNRLGAIFMDARCEGGFDSDYVILYGHNAKDGSMFGGLHEYLDGGYMIARSALSIFLPDGTERQYRIIAARTTDVTDPAYKLDGMTAKQLATLMQSIVAPDDTQKLLALSTCTSNGNDDERLLLFAVAVE